jgi:hypothetical protein
MIILILFMMGLIKLLDRQPKNVVHTERGALYD